MSVDDRTLLEKAAKAAGFEWKRSGNGDWIIRPRGIGLGRRAGDWEIWNPLTDDGDALRLAVKRGMNITITTLGSSARDPDGPWVDEFCAAGDDLNAATRRAIVRAAAALGQISKNALEE